MSFWQFRAVVDGYIDAHCPELEGKASQAEVDDVWAWMQTKPSRVTVA